MNRLEGLINEFIVEVMDNNTMSNYWLDKRIELETLLYQKTAHNTAYIKLPLDSEIIEALPQVYKYDIMKVTAKIKELCNFS